MHKISFLLTLPRFLPFDTLATVCATITTVATAPAFGLQTCEC